MGKNFEKKYSRKRVLKSIFGDVVVQSYEITGKSGPGWHAVIYLHKRQLAGVGPYSTEEQAMNLVLEEFVSRTEKFLLFAKSIPLFGEESKTWEEENATIKIPKKHHWYWNTREEKKE